MDERHAHTAHTAIDIVRGYRPGAIGRIVEMHAEYYSDNWGFGVFFESKVATELSAFLRRYDPATDGLWTVAAPGPGIVGSIVVDGGEGRGAPAHLRWFILAPAARGRGIGQRLLAHAVDFGRAKGFPGIYLWTFAGLDAARRLYEAAGFTLCEELADDQWGKIVTEQKFSLDF